MISQVLKAFPHTGLTCAGMLIFIAIFAGALIWVFRRGSDRYYRDASLMPLELNTNTGSAQNIEEARGA